MKVYIPFDFVISKFNIQNQIHKIFGSLLDNLLHIDFWNFFNAFEQYG